ncbi:MAG: AsmA family protein [Terriglobales bacterium]
MGAKTKWPFWIVTGLAVLAFVAIVALPAWMGNGVIRAQVEQRLSRQLRRRASIGHLSVSLLTGAVEARNCSIAEAPAFGPGPFVHVAALHMRLNFWPLLFSHRLEARVIEIDRMQVRLVRSRRGTWNFATLPPAGPPTAQIGRLTLQQGAITLASAASQREETYWLTAAEARNISPTAAFPITATIRTEGQGTIGIQGELGPLDRQPSLTPLRVTMTARDLKATNLARTAVVLGYRPGDFSISGGVVALHVIGAGSLARPTLSGTANLQDVKLTELALPQTGPLAQLAMTGGSGDILLRSLTAGFQDAPSGLVLRALHANTNFGQVWAQGRVGADQRIAITARVHWSAAPHQSGTAGFLGAFTRLFQKAKAADTKLHIAGTTTHPVVQKIPSPG